MTLERTDARFQTTRWTLLDAVRHAGDPRHDEALSALTERTWPAVYGFLRRTGMTRDDAAETTQAFFADVVLGRTLFERADPAEGRLRALIIAALRRFVIDRSRRARVRPGPIDPARFEQEEARLDAAAPSPERAFDRAWAAGVLSESLRRVERHFTSAGKGAHWAVFESRVLRPAVHGAAPPPLEGAASSLGFRSPADAAAAVQTVKRRLSAVMRELIAETVDNPRDAADEAALLRAALA